MKIVIIDDGISKSLCGLGELVVDLDFTDSSEKPNILSHGTICAAIIKKYVPDAAIGSIRIISGVESRGSVDNLVKAINWCANNRIDIVHMSIGSSEIWDIEKIKNSICRGLESGCIFISAISNSHSWSYPACLSGVIGVKSNSILKGDEFILSQQDEVDFETNSIHSIILSDEHRFESQASNSYAAPVITSWVYRICEKTGERRVGAIKQLLAKEIGNKWRKKARNIDFINPINEYGTCRSSILKNSSKITEFLTEDTRDSYGIAYDGILDDDLYDLMLEKGIVFWDRSHINRHAENDSKMELDIPVIKIAGEKIQALIFGQNLKRAMELEKYPCICVTNEICGALYGYAILENTEEIFEEVEKYGYICLIQFNTNVKADITIVLNSGYCVFENEGESERYVVDEHIFSYLVKRIERTTGNPPN